MPRGPDREGRANQLHIESSSAHEHHTSGSQFKDYSVSTQDATNAETPHVTASRRSRQHDVGGGSKEKGPERIGRSGRGEGVGSADGPATGPGMVVTGTFRTTMDC